MPSFQSIESGIVAITASNATVALFEETVDLYRGKLLSVAKTCLKDLGSHSICKKVQYISVIVETYAFGLICAHFISKFSRA